MPTSLLDCFGPDEVSDAHTVFCFEEAYSSIMQSPGITDLIIGINETRLTCSVSGKEVVQKWGCDAMSLLSFDVMSKALGYMSMCGSDDDKVAENVIYLGPESEDNQPLICAEFLQQVVSNTKERLERTEERFYLTPARAFVTDKVTSLKTAYIEGMLNDIREKEWEYIKPSIFWKHTIEMVNNLSTHVRWSAWQSNHFLWLQDVLHHQQVVHTEWGG